jgi:hypothetical protein
LLIKKKELNHSFFEKKATFAVSKKGSKQRNTGTDEKDISAIEKEKDEHSRLQEENVNSQRQARSGRPQGQRKKETDRFRRVWSQGLIG